MKRMNRILFTKQMYFYIDWLLLEERRDKDLTEVNVLWRYVICDDRMRPLGQRVV